MLYLITLNDTHTHTYTHTHSVGLLCTGDRLDAEISTEHHTTLTTEGYLCHSRDSNPQFRQMIGGRPTPWRTRPPGSALSPL